MKAIKYPFGSYTLIQKVEKSYGLFSQTFQGIGGWMKDFIPIILLHVYNKLSHLESHWYRYRHKKEKTIGPQQQIISFSFYSTNAYVLNGHYFWWIPWSFYLPIVDSKSLEWILPAMRTFFYPDWLHGKCSLKISYLIMHLGYYWIVSTFT